MLSCGRDLSAIISLNLLWRGLVRSYSAKSAHTLRWVFNGERGRGLEEFDNDFFCGVADDLVCIFEDLHHEWSKRSKRKVIL